MAVSQCSKLKSLQTKQLAKLVNTKQMYHFKVAFKTPQAEQLRNSQPLKVFKAYNVLLQQIVMTGSLISLEAIHSLFISTT